VSGSAAFFDLDRTVVEGSTGPVFSDALREWGLLETRRHPLEALLFGTYELIGETAVTVALTRHAARLVEGWEVGLVREAGAAAATRLLGSVAPYLRAELVIQRRAGRAIVMATTSPDELARPLAAALGFDDVIATCYGRGKGRFDGTIDGELLWGDAKWQAVKEWCRRNDVDPTASAAYSDSYNDLPLLDGVGSPVAVNADPRLALVASRRGWAVRSLHEPAAQPDSTGR